MMGSSEDDDARTAMAASLRDIQGSPAASARRVAAKKRKSTNDGRHEDQDNDDTGSDSDDDDKDAEAKDSSSRGGGGGGGGDPHAGDSIHRREKRLAMNRESARARRKRKKVLIDSLEEQVAGLTEENRALRSIVDSLVGKVRQLESELAQSVINRSTLQGGGGSAAAAAASASSVAAAAAAMGRPSWDMGSQESSLLRMLHGPQHPRLAENLPQMRAAAGGSLLHRGGGGAFDVRSLTGSAADRDPAAWDPYRAHLIGSNNPTSMVRPSLQNTLALSSDLGIGSARLNDMLSGLASTNSLMMLPDARAPSAAHASQLPSSSSSSSHHRHHQPSSPPPSISEMLKRQRQLQQRGGGGAEGGKFPPGFLP